jgi:hypothetical protein
MVRFVVAVYPYAAKHSRAASMMRRRVSSADTLAGRPTGLRRGFRGLATASGVGGTSTLCDRATSTMELKSFPHNLLLGHLVMRTHGASHNFSHTGLQQALWRMRSTYGL